MTNEPTQAEALTAIKDSGAICFHEEFITDCPMCLRAKIRSQAAELERLRVIETFHEEVCLHRPAKA